MTVPTAGLLRRLGAMLYDSLLLLALWVVATALLLPFTGGEAIPQQGPGQSLYRLYLLFWAWAFFVGFWAHGGQTLGMKAWRIRLVTDQGDPLHLGQASVRFFAAILAWLPLGLGILWMLWSPSHQTWQDRLSRSRLILLPKD